MASTPLGMHSRLPSPPDEDLDVSSDDTITASRRPSNGNGSVKSYGMDFNSGIPNGRQSPIPSIASRLSSTPATRASSILHSPQSSHTSARTSIPSSPSSPSSSDDEAYAMNDTAHAIAASNSWADLPLLVTFVPPIVALFTGGDYLRDVLLTCLLVWYLYQIIKVPWDIYLASLPPHSQSRSRSRNRTAHNQLSTTRLLALLLSAVTPFLGASLLRLGSTYLYADSLSWFSTSLFVLAAGVRPWRHLTHLLLTRTDALHLAAHRPSHLRPAFLARIAAPHNDQRERDNARIESLENEIGQLRTELAALTGQTRGMGKALKGLEKAVSQRADMIEGRVEVLERHGNGISPDGNVGLGGVWAGLGMVGAGVVGVVKSVMCVAFPFMAQQSPGPRPVRTSGGGVARTPVPHGSWSVQARTTPAPSQLSRLQFDEFPVPSVPPATNAKSHPRRLPSLPAAPRSVAVVISRLSPT